MRKVFSIALLAINFGGTAIAEDSINLESHTLGYCHKLNDVWKCDFGNNIVRKDDYIWVDLDMSTFNKNIDWVEARKICASHWRGTDTYGEVGKKNEHTTIIYDEGFYKPCDIVNQHDDEEERHKKAEEALEEKVKGLADLNKLGNVLGVSK